MARILAIILLTFLNTERIFTQEPDATMTTPELIRRWGFTCINHTVTTSDGYILEMFEIPYYRDNQASVTKGTVLLNHGIFLTSSVWVVNIGENNLALRLSKEGYRVFLGNFRGNQYARGHTTLNPVINIAKFWDFSFHELGYNDIPAQVDHILKVTGQPTIQYVGFSMGTTSVMALLTNSTTYNEKISAAHLLAPVGYLSHIQGPLSAAIKVLQATVCGPLTEELCRGPVTVEMLAKLAAIACTPLCGFCELGTFTLLGIDAEQYNCSRAAVYTSQVFGTTSFRTGVHYGQVSNKGIFGQFDYGILNKAKYNGQAEPPKYEFDKITTSVYMYVGPNDWLGTPEDSEKAFNEMTNAKNKERYVVDWPKFTHPDFYSATDLTRLVNDKVVSNMANVA